MDKRYQVFISSTYEDLKEERNEVLKSVLDMECIPSGMEQFPASDEEPWEYIKELIKLSDYFIIIIAGRYGHVTKDKISFTEREFDCALEYKIPILAFVHNDISELSPDKTESAREIQIRLYNFTTKVEQRLVKKWSNKIQLGEQVSHSLTKQIRKTPRTGWIRGNEITDEHKDCLKKLTDISEKYRECRNKIVEIPYRYAGFDSAKPRVKEIYNKYLIDEVTRSDPIKIRLLGVALEKTFNFIMELIEMSENYNKRIELRISILDTESKRWSELNKRWEYIRKTLEHDIGDLIRIIKNKKLNVSIKLSKYDYMPNIHGLLINKHHLFMSSFYWEEGGKLNGGNNTYEYFEKDIGDRHNDAIIQYKRWFDHSRYNGTVARDQQTIV